MASRFMLRSPRLQARGNPMSSRSSLQHQRRARLRARHHPRYPRARMRAGADEIEVGDVVVAIVHPEPCALRQRRLEAERAPQMRVQIGREILRRIAELGHDPLVDVGDQPATRSEEHTSELQSLMSNSYAVFFLK